MNREIVNDDGTHWAQRPRERDQNKPAPASFPIAAVILPLRRATVEVRVHATYIVDLATRKFMGRNSRFMNFCSTG